MWNFAQLLVYKRTQKSADLLCRIKTQRVHGVAIFKNFPFYIRKSKRKDKKRRGRTPRQIFDFKSPLKKLNKGFALCRKGSERPNCRRVH